MSNKKTNLKLVEDVQVDPFAEVERLRNLVNDNRDEAETAKRKARYNEVGATGARMEVVRYKSAAAVSNGASWATNLKNQRGAESRAAQYRRAAAEARRREAECTSYADQLEQQIDEYRERLTKPLTKDDVLAVCRATAKDDPEGRKHVYAVFGKYGARGIDDVKPEDYAAVINEIEQHI